MITREAYIEFAKRNEIPMELLLDYYNENNQRKEINFSLESFTEVFAQFLNAYSVTLQHVREHFDRLYGVISIYDKTGKLITLI